MLRHVPHLPMFVWTWGTFFTIGVASFVLQLRAGGANAGLLRHCFPAAIWRQKSSWIDILLYLGSKLIAKLRLTYDLVCMSVVAQLTLRALGWLAPHHPVFAPNAFAVLLCSLAVFVVVDFANYLTHYLQHFVPVLWELHKVHHSATALTPFTTERMHPLGNMFDGLVAALLVGVPIGLFGGLFHFSFTEMLLLLANANMIGTILVLDALRHSHFPVRFGPLDRVLLSPHMHQLHHSYRLEHWDKNFGNKLSIWDWAFGTMFAPRPGEEIPVGLGKPEEKEYNSLFGAYLDPLCKIYRLVIGQADPGKPFYARVLWRSPRQSALLVQQTLRAAAQGRPVQPAAGDESRGLASQSRS
ncbi:MAG TPA: sterol desaturase family protein [Acidocella sp.]|jgi:sterol desaturase/sphingolipid hydroxylase (fatty acid hydroxylase superfamily)|nr:sterol desaturase family protein [Acidocella sp.]